MKEYITSLINNKCEWLSSYLHTDNQSLEHILTTLEVELDITREAQQSEDVPEFGPLQAHYDELKRLVEDRRLLEKEAIRQQRLAMRQPTTAPPPAVPDVYDAALMRQLDALEAKQQGAKEALLRMIKREIFTYDGEALAFNPSAPEVAQLLARDPKVKPVQLCDLVLGIALGTMRIVTEQRGGNEWLTIDYTDQKFPVNDIRKLFKNNDVGSRCFKSREFKVSEEVMRWLEYFL